MTLISYSSEQVYCDHLKPIHEGLRARGVEVEHTHGLNARGRVEGNPVLVASRKDAGFFAGRKIILVEHGAGQRYHRDPGGPDIDNRDVILFLAPSQRVADNGKRLYSAAKRVAVGSPRVEYLSKLSRVPERVILAWHWPNGIAPEAKGAWDQYQAASIALSKERDVLGHGHPRIRSRLEKDYKRFHIPSEWRWEECVKQASCLVVDNSSILWEACAIGIPVVVVNARWYRTSDEIKAANRGQDFGLRFWEYADVGPNVNQPGELSEAVRLVLEDDVWAVRRAQAAEYCYGAVEGSTDRAVNEILELL